MIINTLTLLWGSMLGFMFGFIVASTPRHSEDKADAEGKDS